MDWVITKDSISDADELSRVGVCHLGNEFTATLAGDADRRRGQILDHAKTLPYEFQLFDDDGELYYKGKCGDCTNEPAEVAFAPLDWATNDSGCTTMKFRKAGSNAEWEVL
jgi:hypothetical protein